MELSEANSWGLEINPWWLQLIVPMDPGWVLDIKDNWYGKHGHVQNLDLHERYSRKYAGKYEPKQDLIDEAEAWLKQHPEVKVGGAKSCNPGAQSADGDDRSMFPPMASLASAMMTSMSPAA